MMLVQPVFVVGHPRSGTSLVRSLLEQVPDVWTLGREGKPIWERWLHPRRTGWRSNEVGADALDADERRALKAALLAACRRPGPERTPAGKLDLLEFLAAQGVDPYYYDIPVDVLSTRFSGPFRSGPPTSRDGEELDEITPFCFPPLGRPPTEAEVAGGVRMLEKSIQSCFRVPFLDSLFPDATYVFVVRDPRSSIASLMEAWLHPRMFFSYRMPVELRIRGYSDRFEWGTRWWNLSLPPGWQDWVELSLAELCARSWVAHNAAILDVISPLRDDGRAVLLRYEDVVADPSTSLKLVVETARLTPPAVDVGSSVPMVMTQTPPDPDKWLRHRADIERVLPLVEPVASRFGYVT